MSLIMKLALRKMANANNMSDFEHRAVLQDAYLKDYGYFKKPMPYPDSYYVETKPELRALESSLFYKRPLTPNIASLAKRYTESGLYGPRVKNSDDYKAAKLFSSPESFVNSPIADEAREDLWPDIYGKRK